MDTVLRIWAQIFGALVQEGNPQPSGLRDEAECPTDHWDLKPGESCYTCGAAV